MFRYSVDSPIRTTGVLVLLCIRSSWSQPLHDLGWDDAGRLVFLQAKSQTASQRAGVGAHRELYPVTVNLDIETMASNDGITMVFDKKHHVMRVDNGLFTVDGLAWIRFQDQIATTGWAEMWVDTTASEDVSNDVKMYSAGYIEGLISCVRISQYYHNYFHMVMKKEASAHSILAVRNLLKNELEYMRQKANLVPHIMTEEPEDPYWKHSRYLLFQLWGVTDGYNRAAKLFGVKELELIDLALINSAGEMSELMDAYTPMAISGRADAAMFPSLLQKQSNRKGNHGHLRARKQGRLSTAATLMPSVNASQDLLDDAHWEQRMVKHGHCSALVRVADGQSDLYIGHTTWDDYARMTRIYKYYNFPLEGSETMARKISFSSYPGLISSTDDFYIMGSGLTVMTTSLESLQLAPWDKVNDFPLKPHIPNFAHLMITNRLAKNAPHWVRLFASTNTGTYSCQWMIVDYNQFIAGAPIRDNLFWVIETVPGMVKMQDMSHFLRKYSYWPSFNRPFFDEVREVTGHAAAQKTHGALYSWTDNPRAKIFRSASSAINSLYDMRTLMTRNLYPFSGVEPSEPGHEISARMDLSPSGPIPNGGIDAKVASRCLIKNMQVQAESGPAHANQKPFTWASWPGWTHDGQPDTWNFGFIQITLQSTGALVDDTSC